MPDQNSPNDASRKSKAEGERWSPEGSETGAQPGNTDEQAGGISNRPLDEEAANQDAVPERGQSKD